MNRPIRIGFPIIKNIATTKTIVRLATLALDYGHEVVYYTGNQEEDFERDYSHSKIPIIHLPIPRMETSASFQKRLSRYRNLKILLQTKIVPNVDVVVACNDTSPFTFPIVAWARLFKIPTVYYQEGSLGFATLTARGNLLQFLRRAKSLWFDALYHRRFGLTFKWNYALGLNCDFVFAYGTMAKEYFLQFFPEDKVRVVGYVMFDKKSNMTTLKPNKSNRNIYPLQPSVRYSTPESIANEVVQIAKVVGVDLGFPIVIKSRMNFEKVDAILKDEFVKLPHEGRITLVSEGDAVDMLDDADAMLVVSSTVAYYALLKGLPILQLKYMDTGTDLDFYQTGASIPVYSSDELKMKLPLLLNDEDTRTKVYDGMQKAVERHLYKLDGKSGERFVKELEKVVGEITEPV